MKGRTVVVTGGARGLGITLATAVLEAGGDVVCLDILPEPSADEWANITKITKTSSKPQHASYKKCDITKEEEVEAVVLEAAQEAAARGNPIKGLISCAGIQQMKDAIDYPVDGYRRMMEVNVVGNFTTAKHVARVLRDGGKGGSIVFIASMSGQIMNRVGETPANNMRVADKDCTGTALLGLQLVQGGRPPDDPLAVGGMGDVRHPGQLAVARLHSHRHDGPATGREARGGRDMDEGSGVGPPGGPGGLQGRSHLPAGRRKRVADRLGPPHRWRSLRVCMRRWSSGSTLIACVLSAKDDGGAIGFGAHVARDNDRQ